MQADHPAGCRQIDGKSLGHHPVQQSGRKPMPVPNLARRPALKREMYRRVGDDTGEVRRYGFGPGERPNPFHPIAQWSATRQHHSIDSRQQPFGTHYCAPRIRT